MHYWDTSTLAKLYVAEADSPQFLSHLAATGRATTSTVARRELFRVFARKESEKALASGAAEGLFARFEADVAANRIILLPLDARVEERFQNLTLRLHRFTPPIFNRTLDTMHLATADLHGVVEMIVTDVNLRKCATAIGLKVFP